LRGVCKELNSGIGIEIVKKVKFGGG
jgi:hypothetical protein